MNMKMHLFYWMMCHQESMTDSWLASILAFFFQNIQLHDVQIDTGTVPFELISPLWLLKLSGLNMLLISLSILS